MAILCLLWLSTVCDLAPERCSLSHVTLPRQLNPAAVQKLPDADMLQPRWKGYVKKDMLVKLFVITTDRAQLPKAKGTPNDPARFHQAPRRDSRHANPKYAAQASVPVVT